MRKELSCFVLWYLKNEWSDTLNALLYTFMTFIEDVLVSWAPTRIFLYTFMGVIFACLWIVITSAVNSCAWKNPNSISEVMKLHRHEGKFLGSFLQVQIGWETVEWLRRLEFPSQTPFTNIICIVALGSRYRIISWVPPIRRGLCWAVGRSASWILNIARRLLLVWPS